MKRLCLLGTLLALNFSPGAWAGPTIEAVVAVDQKTKPTDTFSPDAAKLYAFFRSTGLQEGDKVRAVWIAEDVGTAAPANTKIDEASLTANGEGFHGAFSLSRPDKGWPPGRYRVDIYLGEKVATSVKFTITEGEAEAEAKAGEGDEGEPENPWREEEQE